MSNYQIAIKSDPVKGAFERMKINENEYNQACALYPDQASEAGLMLQLFANCRAYDFPITSNAFYFSSFYSSAKKKKVFKIMPNKNFALLLASRSKDWGGIKFIYSSDTLESFKKNKAVWKRNQSTGKNEKVLEEVEVKSYEWVQAIIYKKGAEHGFEGMRVYFDEVYNGETNALWVDRASHLHQLRAAIRAVSLAYPEIASFDNEGKDEVITPPMDGTAAILEGEQTHNEATAGTAYQAEVEEEVKDAEEETPPAPAPKKRVAKAPKGQPKQQEIPPADEGIPHADEVAPPPAEPIEAQEGEVEDEDIKF